MLKTYQGSCHCGAVRYEVDLDLAAGTTRCNCTFCRKARNWGARVAPGAFRLLSGEDVLTDYARGPEIHLPFCSRCGVRPFGHGDLPELGGAFVTIQVGSLDDAPDEDLVAAPIQYCDGLNDNWWSPPPETRHL